MEYLGNAGNYLTQTLFSIALYLVLLRFWMQWVNADFANPLGQFLLQLTDPVIMPLRRLLPPLGVIDLATVVCAWLLALLKLGLLLLFLGYSMSWLSLGLFALGEVIRASIYIFSFAIIIEVISSWLSPYNRYHPLVSIASSISAPLLAPVRRVLPPIGGLDLSPLVILIFLQLTLQLVVAPLQG